MTKRAWIIGNGLSLRETPLELLKDEPMVFGMNNIDKAYEWTDWRPTHYIKHEWMDGNEGYRSMVYHMNSGIPCYINMHFFEKIRENMPRTWPPPVTPICTECHHSGSNATNGIPPATWHLPGLCCFASTVGVAAQIAVLEGADELIFVACDLGYKQFNQVKGNPNHFDPSYRIFDMWPIEERDATLTLMHEIISRECRERGIKAWNATIGGVLEVHPRKSIEEFVNGKARS